MKQVSLRYTLTWHIDALQVAEDLTRYVKGEPIQMRPVGWWERRWRWIRRHPGQTAIAGSISLAFLMFLVVISIQTLRLARSQSALEEALRATDVEAEEHHREDEQARQNAERLQHELKQARKEADTLRRQIRVSPDRE